MFFRAAVPLCLCAPLLVSCAYYNSMYYANRYRNEAERAERAGRIAEAQERWRLASLHADSQMSRHPRSKWADDALLVRGQALLHLRSWSDAVVTLQRAVDAAGNGEQRRTAQLFLGEAYAGLRRHPDALPLLDSAVLLRDDSRRSRALLARGRVLLELGRPRDALEDLRASRLPEALPERVRAALAMRDTALAAEFGDSLAVSRHPFREASWAGLLDSMAAAGLDARVSRLVDRLTERDDAGRGARARLFLGEGDRRLAAGDQPAAIERFRAVQRLSPDSLEARLAEARIVRLIISDTRTTEDMALLRSRLESIAMQGGEPARDAQQLSRLIALTDSLLAAEGPADAFWFYRAELLRDSIGARRLAFESFAAMPERFPESPWAPKALVAAIAAGHPEADSLRALLLARYAASPYVMAARGSIEGAEQFAMLEDSLTRALSALPGRTPAPAGPSLQQPGPLQQPATPVPNQNPQQPRGRNRTPDP